MFKYTIEYKDMDIENRWLNFDTLTDIFDLGAIVSRLAQKGYSVKVTSEIIDNN